MVFASSNCEQLIIKFYLELREFKEFRINSSNCEELLKERVNREQLNEGAYAKVKDLIWYSKHS